MQIQLSPQQLQMIRMQLANNTSQPLIIQAAPIQQPTQPQIIQVINYLKRTGYFFNMNVFIFRSKEVAANKFT